MILRLGPDKTSDLLKWHFRTLLTFPELQEGIRDLPVKASPLYKLVLEEQDCH